MNRVLKLDNPIKINNKEYTEFEYNPLKITAAQFSEACAKSSAVTKSRTVSFNFKQTDTALHLYLGMMAVIAVNPEIDIADLERIEGYDVLELTDIGMLFTYRRWEAPSKESNSEEPSENIADTSTQASEM